MKVLVNVQLMYNLDVLKRHDEYISTKSCLYRSQMWNKCFQWNNLHMWWIQNYLYTSEWEIYGFVKNV